MKIKDKTVYTNAAKFIANGTYAYCCSALLHYDRKYVVQLQFFFEPENKPPVWWRIVEDEDSPLENPEAYWETDKYTQLARSLALLLMAEIIK